MGFRALRQAIANRSVLRAIISFVAFTLVLHGAWLIMVVYAFDQGGTAEAGAVTAVVLIPGAVLSPFVAVWFDRLASNLALGFGYLLQGLGLLAVAGAIGVGLTRFVVYGFLALFVIAQMSSRPTMSSILPRIVIDPAELAAANSATGTVETLGLMLGPAVAGLVLYLADSVAVGFLIAGLTMIAAAALAVTIDVSASEALRADDEPDTTSVWSKVRAGTKLLRTQSAPRHLVAVMSGMRLIVGVLEVGVVVIAIDHLGQAEASAGLLGTAIGAGAIAGSAMTFLLVGRRRLSLSIALGVLCASLPVAAIAVTQQMWLVLVLLGLAGLGRPIVEVGGRTLLQGLSTDDMLARIFGLLEGLSLLVLSLGSALFAILTATFDLETALIVTSIIPCVVTLALLTRLRKIDHNRPEVDPALLSTMRRIPIFAPLAAFHIEQMLVNMNECEFEPHEPVFAQGDIGNELFVVTKGWAHIELEQDPVGAGRGGFFGEIALLRDQPRMASVRAGSEGLTAYTLDRDTFLAAIATAPKSGTRSQRVVGQRLGEL